jgi:hypothetical protein
VAQHVVRADAPALHAVLLKCERVHQLRGHGRRVVLLPVRFLDDHFRFLLQLHGVEQRKRDRVDLQVERASEAFLREDKVVVGGVVDRAGIRRATDRRDFLRDLLHAREVLRALEEHVLEEMRHAGHFVGLVKVARLHPRIHRHDAGAGRLARDAVSPLDSVFFRTCPRKESSGVVASLAIGQANHLSAFSSSTLQLNSSSSFCVHPCFS